MKILLNGASGRLGREIAGVACEQGVEIRGIEIHEAGDVQALRTMLSSPSVICDVTLPEGTTSLCNAILALEPKSLSFVRGLVIGTTGHSKADLEVIRRTSEKIPVLLVPNFSRGVFLFEQILTAKTEAGGTVAELARSLGFDLACWEAHHSKKVDAPSGTAKRLASLVGIPEQSVASNRVGHVVGEHALMFSGEGEELRLTHVAHHRRLFALGAVDLCSRLFRSDSSPGLFDKGRFYRGA